jgi:hypothetical protein
MLGALILLPSLAYFLLPPRLFNSASPVTTPLPAKNIPEHV